MEFMNPANGHVEKDTVPWLWTFIFGPLYFAVKGAWAHVFIGIALGLLTGGISWFVYPFFASRIVRNAYLKRGWTEVTGEAGIEEIRADIHEVGSFDFSAEEKDQARKTQVDYESKHFTG